MDIKFRKDVPSRKGPATNFTGNVWQDPIYEAAPPATQRSVLVHFEPGARTAWHTHPLGQTLYIVSGVAHVQAWGGPVQELRPGDVVYFAPDEKHWHGAAPGHFMSHVAVQEAVNGSHVTWLEHVSDDQYSGKA
jgi:quercetin dioxygenase-like cupin family protein